LLNHNPCVAAGQQRGNSFFDGLRRRGVECSAPATSTSNRQISMQTGRLPWPTGNLV
jgi:hypothetical protein